MTRRRTPSFGEPYAARLRTERTAIGELERYVDARVASGHLIGTDWPYEPLLETPPPVPLEFRWHRVDRVIASLGRLRQIAGAWAGQPLKLLDTQARYIIAPTFGWTHPNGRRIIRTVWDEIPRKNGKSTIASGVGLYLFGDDGEAGPQVAAAAADRSQAGLVFRPSLAMANASPYWVERFGDDIRANVIETAGGAGWFKAISADGARQQGLNLHGALIDEVHVHKTDALVDALEKGTGAREQPLILFITTADAGDDHTIYGTKRNYVEGIVAGNIVDPTFRGVVFAAGKDDDPFALETLHRANPGMGYTIHQDYLEAQAAKAAQSPAELNNYLRFHLNRRTKQADRWLAMGPWDYGAVPIPADAYAGRRAFAGLDLASSTDFTAFAILTPVRPDDDADEVADDDAALDALDAIAGRETDLELVRRAGGYYLIVDHWLPEERIPELERKLGVPLEQWVADGWLRTTEGNVIDYRQVRTDVLARLAELDVDPAGLECAFDPWNASETVRELEDAGLAMHPLRQGYASLSAPCHELERLVMGSTADVPLLIHAGNPILRWEADNVAVHTDPNGNLKPSKPDRRKSAKRIDGIAATVNGLARAMLRPPPPKRRRVVAF